MMEILKITFGGTLCFGIATTPIWCNVSYLRPGVYSCHRDGLSVCKDVEQCDRCGSDNKRDESHSEFCKEQGIQLSSNLEVVSEIPVNKRLGADFTEISVSCT